jgi:hypothetical protein
VVAALVASSATTTLKPFSAASLDVSMIAPLEGHAGHDNCGDAMVFEDFLQVGVEELVGERLHERLVPLGGHLGLDGADRHLV